MSQADYRRWICDACGYIYDEAEGDPDSGLTPGTRYEDIPDDWACPLCGLTKGDLRPLPEAAQQPAVAVRPTGAGGANKCRGGDEYVVIVGAGVAGWAAAEAVRARDPDRPLLMVTACEGLVYPKPALSMALAQGKSADELVEQSAEQKAAGLGMSVRTGTRVIKLDTNRRRLTTSKGGITYGKLILALGARQRELPIAGDAVDRLIQVNDLSGYRKLRRALDSGARHVTVLGAGLIGCEFAEDLSAGGYAVTVVDPGTRPLAALLPPPVSEHLRERLAGNGVDWRFQVTLDGLERCRDRIRATLSSGSVVETDLVLSAAGLEANTELARKAGLTVDGAIAVDRNLRTSADNVYAVGDCAAVEGRVYAYIEPIRRQADAVAADLMGQPNPFAHRPPLVRVKTPSLPLTVCPPQMDETSRWEVVESRPHEFRMECHGRNGLQGFALAGASASGGAGLYRQIIERA